MLARLAPRRSPTPHSPDPSELVAFSIIEREDGTAAWIRCGRARLNRDGSVNVSLDALPLSGELHLRPAKAAAPAVPTAAAAAEDHPRRSASAG